MASLPPARGRPGRGEASAADPARPEARGSAEDAAGVLVVDLDLVDELDACRRPELAPDRCWPAADPAAGRLKPIRLVNAPADHRGRGPRHPQGRLRDPALRRVPPER